MVQPAIVVDGRGGLPEETCRQLRRAGAPRVQGGPFAADAAEALMRLSPEERPAAVVLIGTHTVTVEATAPWQRAGVVHLPVTCDGDTSTIGPLIVPGRSACWRCRALTARDLDAVGGAPVGRLHLEPVALPPGGLGVLTAAVTASVILSAVTGKSRLSGVSTELDLAGPSVTHRHWRSHPLCTECPQLPSAVFAPDPRETMAG